MKINIGEREREKERLLERRNKVGLTKKDMLEIRYISKCQCLKKLGGGGAVALVHRPKRVSSQNLVESVIFLGSWQSEKLLSHFSRSLFLALNNCEPTY